MPDHNLFLDRYQRYSKIERGYGRSFNRLSNLRLLVFLVATALIIISSFKEAVAPALVVLFFLGVIFLTLVLKHTKVEREWQIARAMMQIQSRYLSRINGKWTEFEDSGVEFVDSEHPYSCDLDIFGPKSLFQMITVAKTDLGRQHLKNLLESPSKNNDDIKMRQQAVSELANKLEFSQQLECQGLLADKAALATRGLLAYAEEGNPLPGWIRLVRFVPLFTLLVFLLYLLPLGIPVYVPAIVLALQWLFGFIGVRKVSPGLRGVYPFQKGLRAYKNMFLLIEAEAFADDYLTTLKSQLFSQTEPASARMDRLERISDAIDLRYNPIFHFIFNIFLLWDIHWALALEKWKTQNSSRVRAWFATVAAFEALNSLAVLPRIRPQWVFPELVRQGGTIQARQMGHPLILPEKCVHNDLKIDNSSAIITGSNMSGKSTFLRATGMNLVLAYAGTVVCAREFNCSVMDVFTSMVIRDDLMEGISTFYAELARVNMILKHSDQEQALFYLIDEVFRGTNSLDRIAGARVVLGELSKRGAVGLVSTHDFELCDLEKETGANFTNYHFEEQYRQGTIHFDYKLRPGRCTTSNARYLMKMVGIKVD